MEKEECKNKTHVLHSLPAQSHEIAVEDVVIRDFTPTDFPGVLGAKITEDDKLLVYHVTKDYKPKKSVYDRNSLAQISQNDLKFSCSFCKSHNITLLQVVVQGDYLLTYEICGEQNCTSKHDGKLKALHVILARKKVRAGQVSPCPLVLRVCKGRNGVK